MLIQESYHDVPTKADGQGTMRMYTMILLVQHISPLYKAIGAIAPSYRQF